MTAPSQRAGIGRATLYKYFPDVESILVAWHARDFAEYLERLKELSDLETVGLNGVAEFVCTQRRNHAHHHGDDLVGTLAQTIAGFDRTVDDVVHADVHAALTRLVTRLVKREEVRGDLDPVVLARWLFHTIHAPRELDDRAVSRLLVDSLAPRNGQ